jgi:hypothetical protein
MLAAAEVCRYSYSRVRGIMREAEGDGLVERVEGQPGHFTAVVERVQPRAGAATRVALTALS